jgi:hypothetical protein
MRSSLGYCNGDGRSKYKNCGRRSSQTIANVERKEEENKTSQDTFGYDSTTSLIEMCLQPAPFLPE